VETKGLEPSTPGLQSCGDVVPSDVSKQVALSPSRRCTTGCTSEAENVNTGHSQSPAEELAKAVLQLSPAEQAKLAVLLSAILRER
jgi:hypothetical protein